MSTYGDIYSYGILLLEMFTGKRPTDSTFMEGLNLHNFVKVALPERVSNIIDPILIEGRSRNMGNSFPNHTHMQNDDILFECLISIFEIGISCSAELPRERMSISDAFSQLGRIKNRLLQARLLQR